MTTFLVNCTVQEGTIDDATRRQLARAMADAVRAHLDPGARLRALWTDVPEGSGYSGGKAGVACLVNLGVPPGTPDDARAAWLHAACEAWNEIAGVDPYHMMLSAPDAPGARAVIAGVASDLPLRDRVRYGARYARQLLVDAKA